MEAKTSDISVIHPHAAYAAFIHGVISKWNAFQVYVIYLLLPEEIICTRFLPNLSASDVE